MARGDPWLRKLFIFAVSGTIQPSACRIRPMRAYSQSSSAEQAGRWLGYACKRVLQSEPRVTAWLVKQGIPFGVSKSTVWIIKLAILAAVIYLSLVVALFLVALVVFAHLMSNADLSTEQDQPEWRNGVSGFGLYTRDEYRIDPHVFHDD
jgi:hypothetical protein